MRNKWITYLAMITAFLLCASVSYADSDYGSSQAEAWLDIQGDQNNEVFFRIGDAALVDTLNYSLGTPQYTDIPDDLSTSVVIDISVVMVDATEDCVLTVIGADLSDGGSNTIPISRFTLTASSTYTFDDALVNATPVTLETLTTSGRYTGAFGVTYDDSYHIPPGTYTPAAGYAAAFTATIQ